MADEDSNKSDQYWKQKGGLWDIKDGYKKDVGSWTLKLDRKGVPV